MKRKRRNGVARLTVRTQREVVRDVMLSAAECEAWLTLQELARLTKYGEASISAQLRHLRKREHGGFAVEKRQREAAQVIRGTEHGVVWEYRLERPRRVSRYARFGPRASEELRRVCALT